MPFDDEIRRTLDAVKSRLREEIVRQFDDAAAGLAETVERERARIEQASGDATERLSASVAAAEERGREEGREEGFADGRAQGREAALADVRASELAANERLADAIRAMDRASSLSEILDTLVSCAGREATRVAIVLVRGGQLHGWRFIGFGATLDEAAEFELPIVDAGIIGDVVRTGGTRSADSGPDVAPAFAELPAGREVLAVPVAMGGQVVAVLYADQGADAPSRADAPVVWQTTLEVMARHAAQRLQAMTAFRAAQVLTGRPSVPPPAGPAREDAGMRLASAGASGDDHEAASRYARLLMSEIKLYHETDVMAGRRAGDLAVRLGDEIARARVLYEQRVPASVRSATDHFHAELVRTLADGDASLLGSEKLQPGS